MEYRLATPEDMPEIEQVLEADGGTLPPEAQRLYAIARDGEKLAGIWGLRFVAHMGPLWIDTEHRGNGVWKGLNEKLEALFPTGCGYYIFTSQPKMEAIATKLGMKELGFKVWMKVV